MITAFEAIFQEVAGIMNYYKNEAAALVIALALIMSIVRALNVLITQGYDQFLPAVKKQGAMFMVVVFLCLPIFPGAETFLTYFPKTIITAGFNTADIFVSSGTLSKYSTETKDTAFLPRGLTDKVSTARAAMNSGRDGLLERLKKIKNEKAGGWWQTLTGALTGTAMLGLLISVACFALVGVILLFSTAGVGIMVALSVGGPLILTVIWTMCGLVGEAIAMGTMGADYSAGAGLGELSKSLWDTLTVPVMSFIFINIVTFAFYGVIVSCIIKAVIFCVTFPLSVVTMAFEQSRGVFISNIQKAFAIAITPLIAAGVYGVVCASFLALSKSDGLVYQMLSAYLGTIEDGSVTALFSFFFRWLIVSFVGPTVLCLPIAKYIIQTPKIAQELVGAGVGYSSGLSASAAKAGGFSK